jgi:3-oxo-4,17-pregnadiene-20-carboxyl-CoA hydratase alpha subunit
VTDGPVTRPDPTITQDNEFFWEAAADHRLVAQRCGRCHVFRHPPRPMCPHCGSFETDVIELSGRGTVYSWAVLHHPQNPAFEYPIKAALVDLEEGVRMVSNLIGMEPGEIEIGMPVSVTFVPTAGGNAVPVFEASTR